MKRSKMFTFGIFSSHIPYIVIALFYVWCLCFGVGNVASIENETGEKITRIEQFSQKTLNQDHVATFHYFDYRCDRIQHHQYKILYSQSIIWWAEYRSPVLKPNKHGYKLFSRPPPVV